MVKFGDHGLKTPLYGTMAYDVKCSLGKSPGPGAYTPSDPNAKINGGTWGKHSPMSYIDSAIMKTKGIPGPNAYGAPRLPPTGGGKFNTAQAKSELDWIAYRAKKMPGPGQYGNPKIAESRGGKFSTANPKSDVDWMMYRAARMPAPGQYGSPSKEAPKGGRFSMSKPKSDVDWMIYRASQIPGPSQYGAPTLPAPSGGKFNMSNAKTAIEWDIYRASTLPGPGDYAPENSECAKPRRREGAKSVPLPSLEVPQPVLASLQDSLTRQFYERTSGRTLDPLDGGGTGRKAASTRRSRVF